MKKMEILEGLEMLLRNMMQNRHRDPSKFRFITTIHVSSSNGWHQKQLRNH